MKLFKNSLTIACSILVIAPLISADVRKDGTDVYVVDRKESVVTWKGSMQFSKNAHVGYAFMSRGELMTENGKLSGGTVEVDMNTLADKDHGSDNDLIRHLKSPDFFDVEKFPISTFVITKIALVNGKNVNVTGNMTIKGITLAISLPVTIEVKDGVVNANGTVTIDRTKWDVRYNSGKFFDNLADETISDNIELDLKIVARKQ